MRKLGSMLLAGAAACALTGAALAAERDNALHEMVVRMPSGGVAEIRYTGSVPPQVEFASPAFDPLQPGEFERSLAAFDDLSQRLDREVEALLERAQAVHAEPFDDHGLLRASLANDAGRGNFTYSWTSTTVGDRTCTRTVEISTARGDQRPKVVKQSTGDCRNDTNDSFKADWPVMGDPRTLRHQVDGPRNAADGKWGRTTL